MNDLVILRQWSKTAHQCQSVSNTTLSKVNVVLYVLMMLIKLLYPHFSYCDALRKSDLYHLDYNCDLITENAFKEITDL